MKEHRLACMLATLLIANLVLVDLHAATPTDSDACRQTEDLDRAIAACSEALRISPQDSATLTQRGFAYFLKFDDDHAFADYEAAIKSNPKEATTHHYRGIIFQIRGDDDRAIADFTKALDLGSKDPRILIDRGSTYASRGATTQSIADYDTAIHNDPNNWIAHLMRGISYTYGGALEKAQADFKRGAELAPQVPYFPMWLHIARTRASMKSDLASAASNLNMTRWPAPALRMFLGEETPAAVLAYGTNNVKTRHYGDCESTFFVAEFMYLQNQHDEARRLYQASQQKCRRNFVEWVAATAALRSLDTK